MANQYLAVVQQLGVALGRTVGVLDENGVVVACSSFPLINTTRVGLSWDGTQGEVLQRSGYSYRYMDTAQSDHIVFVEGEGDDAKRDCILASIALSGYYDSSDNKNDIASFVKNVVTDNILPSDIFVRARDLDFPIDGATAALVIRSSEGASSVQVLDIIGNLFPEKNKDFIFNVNETDTVLIKSVSSDIVPEDLEQLAASIADVLETEHRILVQIGIGSRVIGVKDMATSFREARTALEVGKVFDTEHNIISYGNLGIARLIYQLPATICQQFLDEVFKEGSIEALDQETLFTIQRFFENNLNVSETSRGLFVHRNTLVYRLEKIKKLTGLDLREFDEAIVFKVALMVRKYLDSTTEIL